MYNNRHRSHHGPNHVAIIMDGNGRWAVDRGLPRTQGHRAGVERIRSVVDYMANHDVKYVTIYAFSTENWNRPKEEVSGIMTILREVIHDQTQELHEHGVRIIHLGSTDRLDEKLKKSVSYAQNLTKDNEGITLSIAFDYGGRREILEAIKALITNNISAETLTEEMLGEYLYTANIPDPDLIIRTGGEYRMSNFLLWQSAYSEFYTTSTPWPELGPQEIEEAFRSYRNRKRRFGTIDSAE